MRKKVLPVRKAIFPRRYRTRGFEVTSFPTHRFAAAQHASCKLLRHKKRSGKREETSGPSSRASSMLQQAVCWQAVCSPNAPQRNTKSYISFLVGDIRTSTTKAISRKMAHKNQQNTPPNNSTHTFSISTGPPLTEAVPLSITLAVHSATHARPSSFSLHICR